MTINTPDSVASVVRRALCTQADPPSRVQLLSTTTNTVAQRRRARRTQRAALIAWAGFACAAATAAHAQVVNCYPGGACYAGPFFDPNNGLTYNGVELWPVDHGSVWAGILYPAPRVITPPPSHQFGGGILYGVSGSDVNSPSSSYWQAYEQSASQNPSLTLDQFNAVQGLNQPGMSVSFDDSSSWDNPPSPPSDWPSDNSSVDSGSPSIDPVSALAFNTDYGSGDGNSPLNGSVGEPISSATGDVFQRQRDYEAQGPFALRLERFYNSLNQVPTLATTEFGTGWRGSYDSAVMLITGQDVPAAVVVRPNGQSLLFTNAGGGNQWTPANPSVRASLISQTDSTGNILGWTYVTGDDFTESYSASGQLLSIANRAGLKQTLTYNPSGQLASVTDPYGSQLLFTYNSQGQLTQATDPAGGHYQYSYDGFNNLTAVTYPDSTTRRYLYENAALPNAMTGIVDENGSRFVTWTYDGQGRATSSVLAGGVQPVSITYNADGSSSVTDARGTTRQHSFTTDPAGALRPTGNTVLSCSSTCPLIASGLTYDFTGLAATGIDPNGNTTQLTFNARGLLASRTEAAGTPLARTVSVTWHAVFHLPAQITFPDRVIRYTYDSQGDRTAKSVTAGSVTRTWTYAYNAQGLLTQVTGPRTDVAQVWHYSYDAQGHLTSSQDPLGHTVQYTAYDTSGHPLTLVTPNGVTVSFTYDSRGRFLTRTVAGRTWSYRRDAAGQVIGVSYPNGTSVTLGYDAAHRLTDVTDNQGRRRHRTLNAAGDALQVQLFDAGNGLVRQKSYSRDGLGRLVASTDANNQTQTVRYDNNGNAVGSTDALGRSGSIRYDALNRPVSVTDPAGQITSVQFNPYDQPTQISAPNGAVTQYSYDSFRQLVQEVSPDRGTSTISYSATGLPLTRTDARGVIASAVYDALNRVTQLQFTGPGNPGTPTWWLQALGSSILSDNVTFTYDQGTGCTFGIGRLCARQDQSGSERYAYDTFGNLTQQTHTLLGFSYSTRYGYDAGNQLTQMTYPDGRVVNYSRDALERISTVQATVNGAASPILSALQYRADNTPSSLTFGNGLTETRSYDPVGRLTNQIVGGADTRSYGFDAVGNLTTKQTSAESDQFTYDSLDRLSAEQRSQGTSAFSNVFSYDPNGNRLTENSNGTVSALNYAANSNRLIQVGTSALTLDAAGNTTSDQGGSRKFYYSQAGRLQWISKNGIPIAGYLYNALGQRTGKLTLQGLTLFHYDIFGRLIAETTIGSQPWRDYIWSGGTPVAQITHWVPIGNMLQLAHCSVGSDGKIDWVTYLHTDGLGTPRIGTDVAQHVVWRWDGEAFGESAPNQSGSIGPFPATVNLRNPGQYFDFETGLFYNVARYYNPQTGRYISSDPIGLGGGLNTYAYAGGSPLGVGDSSGNCPQCIGAIIGAVSGGIGAYVATGGNWTAVAVGATVGAALGAANPFGAAELGEAVASNSVFIDYFVPSTLNNTLANLAGQAAGSELANGDLSAVDLNSAVIYGALASAGATVAAPSGASLFGQLTAESFGATASGAAQYYTTGANGACPY